MSFATSDEIRAHVEGLMKYSFKKTMNTEIKTPFPKFTYKKAMETFGSDKPDIRFGLNLINFTEIANNTNFNVFKEAKTVFGIAIEQEFSRKQIDKLTKLAQTYKAKGLAYVQVTDNKLDKGISKFLNEEEQKQIIKKSNIKSGTIFFVADKWKISTTSLGHLRNKLAQDFNLANPKEFLFSWIVDFPLFAYNEDEKKWEPEHHMFSMPNKEFIDNFEECPEEVTGDLWDLALNGWEMASGSIRVSNPNLQKRILNFVGFPEEKAEEAFGFLLEAYK
jgi:aspartyl-tRNA synthetase